MPILHRGVPEGQAYYQKCSLPCLFSGQRQYPLIFMLLLSIVDNLSMEHGISSHERDDLFDYCLCYKIPVSRSLSNASMPTGFG